MTANRKRWILTLCLILMVCLVGVAYVVTFQRDVLQTMAQDFIAGALGERVTIRQIRVEMFPRPQLKLMGISISDPHRAQPIFEASDIRLGINFFSMGQDALTPNMLIIENAHLDLERDEYGRWNYQDMLQGESSNEWGAFLSGYALEFVNGSIEVEDRLHRDVPLRVRAEAIELQVEQFVLKGPTDVFLSARLSDRGTGSLLSSYGTIEHIGGFLDGDPTEQPPDLLPQLTLHTRMEFDRHTLLQAADFFKVGEVPRGFQGQTSAQGHLHFAPGVQGYDLVVSDLVVLTDVVDLNVEMSMAGFFHPEPPTLSSKWTSTPLAIQHLPQLLPADWLASEVYQDIRRHVPRGKIQAVSATFSGSSRKELGYSLGGEFHVSEGTVTFGSEWGNADQVRGIIRVQPASIRLSDFQGIYDRIPVTEGTGTIVLNEDGPWLTTELVGTVSPTQLLGVVRKIFDWDAGQDSMPSFRSQAGRGVMRIRFGGPLRHPDKVAFQSAEYRPEQVTFHLPEMHGPVTRVSGIISFSPQYLGFENVRGLYGKSDFQIEGKLNFAQQSSIDEVRIRGRAYGHDLVTLFSKPAVSKQEILSGSAKYMVVVTGQPKTPIIRGTVALQGLGIVVPGVIDKAPTLEGQFGFNVRVGKNRHLAFKHVSLTFPSAGLAGRGLIRYGHTPAINVSFTTDPIHFSALPPGLQLLNKTVSAGTLEVSLALQGQGHDWRLWKKSGWVALTKGTVNLDGMTSPVSHVFLRAKLNGHTANLKHLQGRIKESRVRATGTIAQWDSRPNMTLTVTSSQFDLAHLIPRGRQSPLRKAFETIARTATISGNLQFDHAWYKDLSFRALTGRLLIQNSIIGIEDIQGKTEHGTIQGRVLTHLPAQRPATIKTWFDVQQIPLLALEQSFLEAKTLEQRLITGMVSAKGMLAGHGKDKRGILPTLNGDLQISIVDGRVKKGTVVPKILTILNLPSMLQGQIDLQKEGYPFDKQTGTLTIADGHLVSTNIVMDGPILKMTAAGQYDFVHDDLDVVAAASPFGSYFNLLRKISLFEMLMDGNEEGVISALFEIRGSLQAPRVTLMPLESLAFGLTQFGKLAFNVLKNTITLPEKIFFPEGNALQPASQSADFENAEEEF